MSDWDWYEENDNLDDGESNDIYLGLCGISDINLSESTSNDEIPVPYQDLSSQLESNQDQPNQSDDYRNQPNQSDDYQNQPNQSDNCQNQPNQSDYDHDKSSQSFSYQLCPHQQFFNQIAQNVIQFENFERFIGLSPDTFKVEYYKFFKKYSTRPICKELITEYQRLINNLFGNIELMIAYDRNAQRTKECYFNGMAKYAKYIFYFLTVLINIGIINLIEDQRYVIKVRDNNKKRRKAAILFNRNKICTKPIQPGMICDFEIIPQHLLLDIYFREKIQSFYFNLTQSNYPQ